MGAFDGMISGASSGASTGNPYVAAGGAALGLGAGILGAASERDKQEKQGKLRAAEILASPWTNMQPSQTIDFASPTAGKLIGGAGAGLGLAQGFANANQPSPWASMAAKDQTQALQSLPAFGGLDESQKFSINQMPRA